MCLSLSLRSITCRCVTIRLVCVGCLWNSRWLDLAWLVATCLPSDMTGAHNSEPFDPRDACDVADAAAHTLWRDRDAEVAVFADAERRITDLRERLSGNYTQVTAVTSSGQIRGPVLAVASGFVVIGDDTAQHVTAVLALDAIAALYGMPGSSAVNGRAESRVSVGVAYWLTQLSGERVSVVAGDGVCITGGLRHVWADHIDVDSPAGVATVPLPALQSVIASDTH